jgi:hypothetical protein
MLRREAPDDRGKEPVTRIVRAFLLQKGVKRCCNFPAGFWISSRKLSQ